MTKLSVRVAGLGINVFGLTPGIAFGSLIVEKPEQLYRFGKIGKTSTSIVSGEVVYTEPFEIEDGAVFERRGSLDGWYVELRFSESAAPTGPAAKLTMSFSAGQKSIVIPATVVNLYGFSASPVEFSGSLVYAGSPSDADERDREDPRYFPPLPRAGGR